MYVATDTAFVQHMCGMCANLHHTATASSLASLCNTTTHMPKHTSVRMSACTHMSVHRVCAHHVLDHTQPQVHVTIHTVLWQDCRATHVDAHLYTLMHIWIRTCMHMSIHTYLPMSTHMSMHMCARMSMRRCSSRTTGRGALGGAMPPASARA